MTKNQKIMENPEIKCLRVNIERGRICLMDAAHAVIELYYDGKLTYMSANAAIKFLSRVKAPK